ncbi:myelin P2 protein [Lingula anatina]|uniref:Myelin P2 protein n=1 Tax=Lingula anatina TaxID=7574 RepID=A0A1S3HLN5_LINAN|nr:myelin P2 protein [Lingula anatina]|eukprot:XP_013386376.1 myelin P2 protein [Lingula anatina]
MDKFIGKWQLASSDKLKEYMDAVEVAEEFQQKALAVLNLEAKPTHEFSQDGDKYTLKTITGTKTEEMTFKLGEEFEHTAFDGRTGKVLLTMDGDVLVEKWTMNDLSSLNKRVVSGDELTYTLTAKDVVCTRKYNRV